MKGQNVGYVRVSTVGQNTDRQLDGVDLDRLFEDRASGKDTERPALAEALKYVRQGDVLHVHSLDRLARNLDDLRQIVKALTSRGVRVQFHKESLVFSGDDSPMSVLLLSVMGAFAEFERALIRERQREGIELAKARGAYRGRKPKLNDTQIADLRARAAAGENKTKLAREAGISRANLYVYLGKASP